MRGSRLSAVGYRQSAVGGRLSAVGRLPIADGRWPNGASKMGATSIVHKAISAAQRKSMVGQDPLKSAKSLSSEEMARLAQVFMLEYLCCFRLVVDSADWFVKMKSPRFSGGSKGTRGEGRGLAATRRGARRTRFRAGKEKPASGQDAGCCKRGWLAFLATCPVSRAGVVRPGNFAGSEPCAW